MSDQSAMFGWVVTHVDHYDDEESLRRAVIDYAPSAPAAWRKYLALVGKTRKEWNDRGYVARRVMIKVEFEK